MKSESVAPRTLRDAVGDIHREQLVYHTSGKILGKVLKLLADTYSSFFITGASGFGKSWLAKQLEGSKASLGPVIHLDDFSRVVGNEWVLDEAKLPKDASIYEGNSTGGGETVTALVDCVIVPVPSYDSFLAIMRAKYRDGAAKGLPSAWLRGWRDKSEYTRSQYFKYVISKIRLVCKHTRADVTIHVLETPMINDREEVRGWD